MWIDEYIVESQKGTRKKFTYKEWKLCLEYAKQLSIEEGVKVEIKHHYETTSPKDGFPMHVYNKTAHALKGRIIYDSYKGENKMFTKDELTKINKLYDSVVNDSIKDSSGGSKFTKAGSSNLYELCNKYNWYTVGDIDAYDKMLTNAANGTWNVNQVAVDIAKHSDNVDAKKVVSIIIDYNKKLYGNMLKDSLLNDSNYFKATFKKKGIFTSCMIEANSESKAQEIADRYAHEWSYEFAGMNKISENEAESLKKKGMSIIDSVIKDANYTISGYDGPNDKMLKEDIATAKKYGLQAWKEEMADGEWELVVQGSKAKVIKYVDEYLGLDTSGISDSCKDADDTKLDRDFDYLKDAMQFLLKQSDKYNPKALKNYIESVQKWANTCLKDF